MFFIKWEMRLDLTKKCRYFCFCFWKRSRPRGEWRQVQSLWRREKQFWTDKCRFWRRRYNVQGLVVGGSKIVKEGGIAWCAFHKAWYEHKSNIVLCFAMMIAEVLDADVGVVGGMLVRLERLVKNVTTFYNNFINIFIIHFHTDMFNVSSFS